MLARAMWVGLCVCLWSCSSNEPSESGEKAEATKAAAEKPKPEAPAAPSDPDPDATRDLMRGHFEKALVAREALIRADLDEARAAMTWLAEHQRADDLPVVLRGLLKDMQATASEFEKAESLREAADVMAATLSRCGSCHEAAEKGPELASTPLPEGSDGKAHMRRHHWAAQRMWEGLVSASPERFDEATAALDEEPIRPKALGASAAYAQNVAKLDAHIHQLRSKVQEPNTEAGRIELYARTLATCATCHQMMGQGPAPAQDAALGLPEASE